MKGLVLVDAEEPRWKRIMPVANLIAIASGPEKLNSSSMRGRLGPLSP